MIQNNQELEAMLARIRHFQRQVKKLREVETNPQNYQLSAGGFLAEIDRMNFEKVIDKSVYLLYNLMQEDIIVVEEEK